MTMNRRARLLPCTGRSFTRLTVLALSLAMALPPLQAQTASGRAKAPVTVNFVNADLEAVTRAFAAMIDRQIAVDPRVKGTLTVYSEQPQSVAEAYQAYLSALRGDRVDFPLADDLDEASEPDALSFAAPTSGPEAASSGGGEPTTGEPAPFEAIPARGGIKISRVEANPGIAVPIGSQSGA